MVVSANATTVAAGTSTGGGTVAGTATYTINGIAIPITGATGGARSRATAPTRWRRSTPNRRRRVSRPPTPARHQPDRRRRTQRRGLLCGRHVHDIGRRRLRPARRVDDGRHAQHQLLGAHRHQRQRRLRPDRRPDVVDGDHVHRHLGERDGHLDRRRRQRGADGDRRGAADGNSSRAMLGAVQNRFSATIENLQTGSENTTASRSRIQDTDFRRGNRQPVTRQVLQQAGTADGGAGQPAAAAGAAAAQELSSGGPRGRPTTRRREARSSPAAPVDNPPMATQRIAATPQAPT